MQANDLYDRIARDPSIQLFSIKDSLSVVFRYVPVTTPAQPWTADRSFLNNLNEQLLLGMATHERTNTLTHRCSRATRYLDLDELAARLCLDIVNINDNTCLRFRPLNHYARTSVSQWRSASFPFAHKSLVCVCSDEHLAVAH